MKELRKGRGFDCAPPFLFSAIGTDGCERRTKTEYFSRPFHPLLRFQAGASGTVFNFQAFRTLRMQRVALSVPPIVWCACVAVLEPRLGGIGARTPEIPLSIMVSKFCRDVASVLPSSEPSGSPDRGAEETSRERRRRQSLTKSGHGESEQRC